MKRTKQPVSRFTKAVREAVFRAFSSRAPIHSPRDLLRHAVRAALAAFAAGTVAWTSGISAKPIAGPNGLPPGAVSVARHRSGQEAFSGSTGQELQQTGPFVVTPGVANTSLTEGDSGAANMVFTVTRASSPSGETAPFLVDFTTVDGTAVAGTDYTPVSGTLRFAAGQNTATVNVPIIGNRVFQSNRQFTLRLSNAQPDTSFATATDIATPNSSVFVTQADVNGDGRLDAVVVNSSPASLGVLLNQTAPGATAPVFSPRTTFNAGTGPKSATMGDVNGDGRPDAVVADSSGNSVAVLLNQTAPGATAAVFSAPTFIANTGGPVSVALADVNGDGRLDALTANSTGNTLSVSINQTPPGATAPSFSTPNTFGSGSQPNSVAVADVNSDGKPDALVANSGSNTVSVLVNQTATGATAANFSAQTPLLTGTQPYSVATADLNGDGRADVLAANRGGNTVSVSLNQTATGATTPSFGIRTDFPVGTTPSAVTARDINGDGRPDAITANSSGTLSVLVNTTTTGATSPRFAAQRTLAAGGNPVSVSTADINSDGRPDLIAANGTPGGLSVLLDDRLPISVPVSFSAQRTFGPGFGSQSVATADINGDGKPDALGVSYFSNRLTALVNSTAPGATTPAFSGPSTFAGGGTPYSVTAADINGDGRPDALVTNVFSDSWSLFINRTAAGATIPDFAPQTSFATGRTPKSIKTADVNGDGRPDVLIANQDSDAIFVVLNQTAPGSTIPSFAPQASFATGYSPSSVAATDVNGDGRLDLLAADYNSNSISVLLNATTPGSTVPSFSAHATFAAGVNPISITSADLNGDGKQDALVTNINSGTMSVLTNQTTTGATTPNFSTPTTFATMSLPFGITTADVTGDGRPEALVTNADSLTVSVFANTTSPGATLPGFAPQTTFAVGGTPVAIVTADVNGDGRTDALVANRGSSTLSVLPNTAQAVTTNSQATGTIVDNDAPATMTAVAGTTPQSTPVNSAFPTPLAVDVRNSLGNLVQGVTVAFSGPGSGASGTFSAPGTGNTFTGTSDASGRVVAPTFTANGTGGSYTATATATGGTNPGTTFGLTNTVVCPTTLTATANGSTTPIEVNVGTTLTLAASAVPGATYAWTGPNFSSSSQNPTPFTVAANQSGTYTVTATVAGCTTLQSSVQVVVRANAQVAQFVTSTQFNAAAPPPNFVGTFTINTSLTNTGNTAIGGNRLFYRVVTLEKLVPGANTPPENRLLVGGNPATPNNGLVGSEQDLDLTVVGNNNTTLDPGETVPVTFTVGLGTREAFRFFVDLFGTTTASPTPRSLGRFQITVDETQVRAVPVSTTPLRFATGNIPLVGGSGVQSSPCIAVDSTNPLRAVAAATDFATNSVAVMVTGDGGATWRSLDVGRTFNGATYAVAQAPSAAWVNGELQVAFVAANLTNSATAIVLARSTDGLRFNQFQILDQIPAGTPVALMKPTTAGGVTTWSRYDAATRTTTVWLFNVGGQRPIRLQVATGDEPTVTTFRGQAYIGWTDADGRLLVARFDGLRLSTPVEVARPGITAQTRIPALADRAASANFTLAVDDRGTLYGVYTGVGNGLDVFLTRSTDNGATWSRPVVVNDATAGDQFLPALSTAGGVFVSWSDTRLDASRQRADRFFAGSKDGEMFGAAQRVSTASSNASRSNPTRDYTFNLGTKAGIAFINGFNWFVWTDNRGGNEDVYISRQ